MDKNDLFVQAIEPMALKKTSWQPVQDWYDKLVGDEGHYYHQSVVIPGVIRLLELSQTEKPALLDLACGQGVLARHLPDVVDYCGIDIADTLIAAARQRDRNRRHQYLVGDASEALPTDKRDFSHATIILALQNIEHGDKAVANVGKHLGKGGRCVIVLNHPCYRIPRQSAWDIDAQNKLQYRRVNRYMTPLPVPMQHRGKQGSQDATTWSFHHPLSDYCKWIKENGMAIHSIEEWCSDKVSTGAAAKMENRCRQEFPLFMAIVAMKV